MSFCNQCTYPTAPRGLGRRLIFRSRVRAFRPPKFHSTASFVGGLKVVAKLSFFRLYNRGRHFPRAERLGGDIGAGTIRRVVVD